MYARSKEKPSNAVHLKVRFSNIHSSGLTGPLLSLTTSFGVMVLR